MKNKKLVKALKITAVCLAGVILLCLVIFVIVPAVERDDITNYYTVNSAMGDVATFYNFPNSLQINPTAKATTTVAGVCKLTQHYIEGGQTAVYKRGDEVEKGDPIVRVGNIDCVAPITGTIKDILIVDGQTVAAGAVIFEMYDLVNFRLSLRISEYDAKNIKEGGNALVTINVTKAQYNGTIVYRDLVGSASNGVCYLNVIVEFNKNDDYIHPIEDKTNANEEQIKPPVVETPWITGGMTCQVNLTKDIARGVVKVPMKAIQVDNGNKAYVQVLDAESKKLKRVDVKVGLNDGKFIEIVEGISADTVIYYPKASATKTLLDSIR